MSNADLICKVLDDLNLVYDKFEMDKDTIEFAIKTDDSEEIAFAGVLYEIEGNTFFRMMIYVDELSEERREEQQQIVLTMNGEISYGCYALNPDEGYLFYTINLPVDNAIGKLLGFLIDFLFEAQDFYDQQFYGSDEKAMPQG